MSKSLSAGVLLLASIALTSVGVLSGSTPAGPPSPKIIAAKSWTGVSTPIPSTTLFTATTTGLYRISLYQAITTPGTSFCYWQSSLGWTDDVGVESGGGTGVFNSAGPPNASSSSTFVLRAVAGTAVTYSTSTTSGCTGDSGTYEFFLTAEEL
jgi:hypothetical protein